MPRHACSQRVIEKSLTSSCVLFSPPEVKEKMSIHYFLAIKITGFKLQTTFLVLTDNVILFYKKREKHMQQWKTKLWELVVVAVIQSKFSLFKKNPRKHIFMFAQTRKFQ